MYSQDFTRKVCTISQQDGKIIWSYDILGSDPILWNAALAVDNQFVYYSNLGVVTSIDKMNGDWVESYNTTTPSNVDFPSNVLAIDQGGIYAGDKELLRAF